MDNRLSVLLLPIVPISVLINLSSSVMVMLFPCVVEWLLKRLFFFPLSMSLSYAMSIELSRIILKFFFNRGSLCVRGRSHLYIYVH